MSAIDPLLPVVNRKSSRSELDGISWQRREAWSTDAKRWYAGRTRTKSLPIALETLVTHLRSDSTVRPHLECIL